MFSPRPTGRSFGLLLMALTLMGCADNPTDPNLEITGVSVTATPNPAQLTLTVQVSAAVLPAGTNQSVTWASSDETVATVNASGVVTLLLRGTVTITATSTVNPLRFGSVTLTVVCPDPRLVTQNISSDATWENWVPDPACFDYVVQTDLQTNAQTLTIEPGTVVGFEEGLGMRIRSSAALIAEGTQADPIVLTGTTRQRGWWKGVALEFTVDVRNVVAHTVVEYTGGAAISNSQDASLMLIGGSHARVENSTFRQSSAYGLFLDRDVEMVGSGGNDLTGNALGAAWVYGTEASDLQGSTFAGNDVDIVVVSPNAITASVVWPAAVYHVLRVNSQSFTVLGGELTLEPGTTLRFEGDQSLLVMSGGGFRAVGTAANPIVLTGTQAIRGHWGGLGILDTDHAMNRLEHVIIEYGGGRIIGFGTNQPSNLVLSPGGQVPSRITIQNTILRESAMYGLYASLGSELTDFQGNTLTSNFAGPVYVDAPMVDDLLSSNTYSGNDTDEVAVETGVSKNITEPATWRDLGVPYHLRYSIGHVTDVNSALTIEPGVELLMAPGLGVIVRDGGSMSAIGTEMNRITMTAKAGAWQGLAFVDATGSFDYIDILDGGSETWGGVLQPGNVTIMAAYTSSTVFFTGNVTLTGAAYGIVFSFGESIAVGCPGSVFVPPPDMVADHCRPPSQ